MSSYKYYTNGTTEMIVPDSQTPPQGFYLANNTATGNPTTIPFWDGNLTTVPLKINSLVPPGYYPVSTRSDITYTYRVYNASNLNFQVVYVTGNAAPTSGIQGDDIGDVYLIGMSSKNGFGVLAETYVPSTTVRSTGTYYTNPITGTSIYIDAGSTVPDGWVLTASIPINTVIQQNSSSIPITRQTNKHKQGGPVTSGTQTNDVPVGYETYVIPNGKYIVVPEGLQHPASWILVNTGATGGSNNQTDLGANVDPWGAVPIDLVPMPVAPANTPAGISLGQIIALLGLGGIIYIGYLFWFHPNSIRAAVKAFDEFKVLFVDASQLLIALATIAALSFVSYEFWTAYQATGSIAGALGQLAANVIETFAIAFVDALEQLAKDAWNAIVADIKSILPSWL